MASYNVGVPKNSLEKENPDQSSAREFKNNVTSKPHNAILHLYALPSSIDNISNTVHTIAY